MTYISALLSENRKFVKVWERNENGERVCKKYDAPFYFYVEDEDGEFEDLYDGKKLSRLDYDSASDFFDARKKFEEKKLKLYESDIPPEYKILAEHYFNSEIGKLHVTFYDIEVDYDKDRGFSSPTNPYAPINSIALYHEYSDRTVVLVVPPKTRKDYTHSDLPDDIKEGAEVIVCKDEKELLKIFFEEIEDTDIISGWNSDMFDNPYVYERAKLVFSEKFANRFCFDESREPYYREIEIYGNINKKLCIHGRVSLDYIDVYKKFEMSEKPSYALEAVSEDELPHLPKLSYTGSLYDLYRNNFEEFIRYNIRDTLILKGLEQKKRYIRLAIQMSHSATSKIEDVLGTTKVAEMSVLNYCHYNLGKIIPDYKPPEGLSGDKYEGAIVLPPNVGMHKWIASLDIASLYPSTMRSLNISPETITGQFIEGADAYKEIFEESDKDISFKEEKSGKFYTAPAKKWKTFLKKNNWTVSGGGTTFHQDYDGVIPSVLTQWFNERKEYKKKMFEASQRGDKEAQEYYDNMQYIKKIQLNSMYGATGNKYFKFYDVRLAKSTTLSGREILMHMVKKIAEKLDGKYEWPSKSIYYGDTDSSYFYTRANTKEKSLLIANKLCDIVNKSYPGFMRDAFNCDDNHDKLIKAEQEIVSDRGIFIKKKYYILHLVSKDGKDVDEMKNMGVPIKKTTLPKEIKIELESYIERLLKGESWDIIGPEIVAYKDKIKNLDNPLVLGLPTGVKKVEYYTELFNSNDPDLKSLPGHVAASILWNKSLNVYGDKESPKIVSGSKIKVFYLKNKIDRFKSIAVPKELSEPPEWFLEHFEPIIDKDAQITRLVDNPMKIMISAAGLKVPTKKKILFEKVFE